MIVTTTFQRKTYVVQAIQLKDDNMKELAEWCSGEFKIHDSNDHRNSSIYRVGQPRIEISMTPNGRKARAYSGDWITNISGSDRFKIYRDKTFKEAFEEVLRDFPEEMMRKVVREEMRALLLSMGETSGALYKRCARGELEGAGYRAISNVIALEESLLPHAWNCNVRNPAGWDDQGNELKCSCGVGDDE